MRSLRKIVRVNPYLRTPPPMKAAFLKAACDASIRHPICHKFLAVA